MTFVTMALSVCRGVAVRTSIAAAPSCTALSSVKSTLIAQPTAAHSGTAALRMCAWEGKRLVIIARTTTNASLKFAQWKMTLRN